MINYMLVYDNFFYTLALLWFFLFSFITFKIVTNKVFNNKKFLNKKNSSSFNNVNYQKIFYISLLLFLLTQLLPARTFSPHTTLINNEYHYQWFIIIFKYVNPVFTITALYFFILAFLLNNTKTQKKEKQNLKFLSFSILFINLLFNLIIIPNQIFFLLKIDLLTITSIINFLIFGLLYVLIFRLVFHFFKYFFNFSFIHLVKLTFCIFKYQTIKIALLENKKSFLKILKQLWDVFLQINENQENYFLLLKLVMPINATNDWEQTDIAYFANNEINKNGLKIFINHKTMIFNNKSLKDFIIINGWKMSLLQ